VKFWIVGLVTVVVIRCCSAQVASEASPGSTSRQMSSERPSGTMQSTPFKEGQAGGLAPGEDPENRPGMLLLKHLALDQKQFWTSPFRTDTDRQDMKVFVPFVGFTAGLIAGDSWISRQVPDSPSQIKRSQNISDYGVYSLVGVAGGSYLWGSLTHNDHMRESGFLAGEAAVNSTAVAFLFKAITQRPRSLEADHNGTFFQGGSSFPSEHCAIAWSVASALAHEYPGLLTKLAAYGLASAVTVTRVTGKQHFSADVVVGSALGWYFGRQIYRAHHDPELGGSSWGNVIEHSDDSDKPRNPQHMGSPSVPLDSWIYPALERLVAFGYIKTAFLGAKPWTRMESASLVSEAKEKIDLEEGRGDAAKLELQLEQEFAYELGLLEGNANRTATIESFYSRMVSVTGSPLNGSYHFGQTIINNFGRPYQEGFNGSDGFSGWAAAGPFTIYVRGEYQHAPLAPAYPLPVREAIAVADNNPVQPATPFSRMDRFRLLDTYVAAQFETWNVAFGKQSLWWGPGEGGALLLSDNAEPIYMLRASRVAPLGLPSIFRVLGPMRTDLFFGKLSGNGFPPQPFIHGEKISFKPTANLELGFARTSELGGTGRPLTAAAIFNSYFGLKASGDYPSNANPGKRTVDFTFSYNVPGARNWLTVYADMLLPQSNYFNVDTNSSPINIYRRLAMRPGFYLVRVPRVRKLDFRAEAVYTDPPTARSRNGKYVYWDYFYRDSHSNKGNLIGDWIGREGMGFQGWSTYWFTPRSSLQLTYRHAKVSSDFIPGGETLNDGSAKLEWWLGKDFSVSANLQYEKWLAPILAPTPQRNWTSMIQLTFHPHLSAGLR